MILPMNKTYDLHPGSTLAKHLSESVFAVEASIYEQHLLWQQFALEADHLSRLKGASDVHRIQWKSHLTGEGKTIGMVAGRPISLMFSWDTLRGKKIVFWWATSELVDHKMANDWLHLHLPLLIGTTTQRWLFTDAQNFHLALHHVNNLVDKEADTQRALQVVS
jgi:hypothetical protein